jgi:hypothetical protein
VHLREEGGKFTLLLKRTSGLISISVHGQLSNLFSQLILITSVRSVEWLLLNWSSQIHLTDERSLNVTFSAVDCAARSPYKNALGRRMHDFARRSSMRAHNVLISALSKMLDFNDACGEFR